MLDVLVLDKKHNLYEKENRLFSPNVNPFSITCSNKGSIN